ncbi:MAG: N-acetyltransferase family protein [Betaproteobacteria bacterium]|jgi:L-amino acid N-acyltransferase|nr:N-acetyltransferase family protein [Betaproteobacteria bacterium]
MTNVSLRAAEVRDAEAIADIYNYEVENTSATFDLVPRSIEAQREWITARTGAFAAIVAEDSSVGVIGFAALSTYRDRAGYRTTVENSVYVHRDHQRRGVGRLLLTNLLEMARSSGFHTVIARIDTQSIGSLALHKSLGFNEVGVEQQIGRKFGRWLDSAILQKIIS